MAKTDIHLVNADDDVVLFIDMLGFAALIEQTPDAVAQLEPIFQPLTFFDTLTAISKSKKKGPLVSQFTSFHLALEKRIRNDIKNGITAITFSDSAFIHLPSPDLAIAFSRALMRELLKSGVPARMGIGAGSFSALRFISDSTQTARVHSTQFLGTAVVRAYQAETCGVQGLRILLHPSMKNLLSSVDDNAWLPLPDKYPNAHTEANFLYMSSEKPHVSGPLAVRKRFTTYKDKVDEMREAAPAGKKHYYENTVTAMRRMREQLV